MTEKPNILRKLRILVDGSLEKTIRVETKSDGGDGIHHVSYEGQSSNGNGIIPVADYTMPLSTLIATVQGGAERRYPGREIKIEEYTLTNVYARDKNHTQVKT